MSLDIFLVILVLIVVVVVLVLVAVVVHLVLVIVHIPVIVTDRGVLVVVYRLFFVIAVIVAFGRWVAVFSSRCATFANWARTLCCARSLLSTR